MTTIVRKTLFCLVMLAGAAQAAEQPKADALGNWLVSINGPLTAFGELSVATPQPVAQVDFVYGANPNLITTNVTGSGTVTTTNALAIVNTTAAINSSAYIQTARYLKYRAGQGALSRFTALFTTGVAGSTQIAGPINNNDGFAFGYNGTSFGLLHRNGGVDTWVAQTSWNIDKMDGALGSGNPSRQAIDPTKFNVYQIQFQYLGAGVIFFGVEDARTGKFSPVHAIRYANANTESSLKNPSLPIRWSVANTTNATAIQLKTVCGAMFTEGDIRYLGPRYGASASATGVTISTNMVTLVNATTLNGVSNQTLIRVRNISFGSNTGGAGSGVTTLKITKNSTLGGSPTYAAIDGTTADNGVTLTAASSAITKATVGSVTGGREVYNAVVAVGTSMAQDVTELDIFIGPSESLTFQIGSTQSATVGFGVTWNEDQ